MPLEGLPVFRMGKGGVTGKTILPIFYLAKVGPMAGLTTLKTSPIGRIDLGTMSPLVRNPLLG